MASHDQQPDSSLSSQAGAAPYQAPLTDHEPHRDHRIKGYNVYLRPGHSIADHNAAIGTKIEPFFKFKPYKQKSPKMIDQDEYVFYTTTHIDDDLLASIRADPGVEEVDYYHLPLPDTFCPPTDSHVPAPIPYSAPLYNKHPQREYEQKTYIVYLRPGHSLADHNAATGTDIQPFIESKLEMQEDEDGADRITYHATNIDDDHLAAVRADIGVEKVDHYHSVARKPGDEGY